MELSTRYEPAQTEEKWLKIWSDKNYWHADENSDKPPYTIVIPPPNITGILHMGHALNNTLQDVLIRWKRMAGYATLWLPGTDHASIATQYVVERRLAKQGIKRKELGREKFLEEVWKWKNEHGSTIIEQLKKLGCSCDWERERFTMDEGLSRAVRTVFKKFYDDGLIYKGNYLVNWCPRCQTTIADDEVEYADKPGKLWYMRYPIKDMPGQFVTVATTRPETMLGDTAVAVNPSDERYKHLVGKMVELPLTDRLIPIIADDFVDKEFGTGMVKITPAHDPNDYQAGKRHGLEEINVLTPDGKMNEIAPKYQGMDRYEARKAVVADLDAIGLLEKIEEHPQRIGVCYRCNTVIEPYISKQWFVKMKPLVGPAKNAVNSGRIKFYPEARAKEYNYWLDNVRDWPVSRQLWWGHRIPAWYGPDGEIFVSDKDELPDEPKFKEQTWTRDQDVLDTWFSSALWPFSTLGWPDNTKELKKFYPTSTLITGKEILFFWVARMIITGLYFMDEIPFSKVYFNPVVADETGKKMSKSKGNVIDPRDMMAKYGTDALRYTLTVDATREQYIAFSEKACEANRNFMNKLWNAARFVFSTTEGLTPDMIATAIPADKAGLQAMRVEDRWIVSRYARCIKAVNNALENFDYDILVKSIYDFFWRDFCDYYLETAKPRLYNKENPDMVAKGILVIMLEGVMRLLHPVCPFITEEIWSTLRTNFMTGNFDKAVPTLGSKMLAVLEGAEHCCVAPWNDFAPDYLLDDAAETEMKSLQDLIYAIRNIRGELQLQPGMAARVIISTPNATDRTLFMKSESFFATLTKLAKLDICETFVAPAFGAHATVGEATVFVELPEQMLKQEKERIARDLEKAQKDFRIQTEKLANTNFTSRAPAAVIDKEKAKLAHYESTVKELSERLAKLN